MNINVKRSVCSVMGLIHQCLWLPASSASCFLSLCPLVKPKKVLGESLRCKRASCSGFNCVLPRLPVNSVLCLFALFCYSNRNKRKKFSSLFRKKTFSLLLVWKHQPVGARNGVLDHSCRPVILRHCVRKKACGCHHMLLLFPYSLLKCSFLFRLLGFFFPVSLCVVAFALNVDEENLVPPQELIWG